MKKIKNVGAGDVGSDIFRACSLHFVLRYYCTVRDLHYSRSKMERKSLLSGVGLPVSMAAPSPKVRSGPAMILEPVEAS